MSVGMKFLVVGVFYLFRKKVINNLVITIVFYLKM